MSWDGRSWGGLVVLRLVRPLVAMAGFHGLRLLGLLFTAPVILLMPRLQSATRDYWWRLDPNKDALTAGLAGWWQLASFCAILADRAVVYQRWQDVRFQQRGWQILRDQIKARRGCILLSAHMGNWELAGRLLGRLSGDRVPVNLVKIDNESETERAMVDAAMGDARPAVIDPRDPIKAGLAISAALQRGEIVCMLGDRAAPGQIADRVSVLGQAVALPVGPFQVAALTGVPIIPCFLMLRRPGVYRLEVFGPWYADARGNRQQRRRALHGDMQRWACLLESQMRRYPRQWHNFFHYWKVAGQRKRRRSASA